MKTTSILLAVAGAVVVSAVDYPADFPACGKLCADNLFAIASTFSCGADDIACLCKAQNWAYGIRDCSIQACQDDSKANTVISWSNQLCADAGAPLNLPLASGGSNSASASATGTDGSSTPSPITTSEVVATITSGGSTFESTSLTTIFATGSDAGATPSAVTTSAFTSVISSGSIVSTITGLTTISGLNGVPGATTIPQTTVTSAVVSTSISGSVTSETTVGSTTLTKSVTGSALSSALSSQASEASTAAASSTSSGNGVQKTAAPIAGLLAAAGIAAAFL
ncbi:hypothetical protein B0T25DRAFT_325094 [Lasiosphaeria hispida]|uniref:CFEM domain-containing protein n=1 Tax=Lasiosphaeria hispida TaxID=260671 RepID=A0AAJ0H9V4_9PEZI|nr:hypothetical protein B0T25DRAFT_325094 [Lasiosphaeria hispida]